ncbi:MAG: hypothetical protein DMF81_20875, partial [Acidobacteria bacterium]
MTVTGPERKSASEAGEVIVTSRRCTALKLTVMLRVAALPARSSDSTTIGFAPWLSMTGQEKDDPVTRAGMPLQERWSSPERLSSLEPVTLMADSLVDVPSAGDVMVRLGGVLSRLTLALADELLPAWSVAVPEAVWFSPSLLIVTSGGQLCTC